MTQVLTTPTRVTAPRATLVLDLVLAVGIGCQAVFAGGFLGGDHGWWPWHEALGNPLVLPPLASLVLALILHRRQPEPGSVLVERIVLVLLVLLVEVSGHAGWLMLHIPAAVLIMALVARQLVRLTSDRSTRSQRR